jgi:type VI secretion system protein VasI
MLEAGDRIKVTRITQQITVLMLLSVTLPTFVLADSLPKNISNQITAAQTCINISARLERLACFDEVFNTPVAGTIADNDYLLKPESWVRAWNAEISRNDNQGFVVTYLDSENPHSGIWLTTTALMDGSKTDQSGPVLMLSCIDNISRVELVLPEATNSGKVRITISGKTDVTQNWVSDDSGTVLRTGRGLASIEVMKTLLSSGRVVFRSNVEQFDFLYFDTSNLNQVIKPMRKSCGW